jgi:hypothetical protein
LTNVTKASGPRQRLQPGGSIVVVMTRWAQDDLTGRLLKAQTNPGADKWDMVNFPAIMDDGQPVWPEYWSLEELESVKASIPHNVGMLSICKSLLQKRELF